MPFTLCLDVTLRVAAIPDAAKAALRLQSEFTELARDPHRWPFRYVQADVEGDVLVIRALLLEPIRELYDPEGTAGDEPVATDVLLALLDAGSSAWRALEVAAPDVSAHVHRVRRRYWTRPLDG